MSKHTVNTEGLIAAIVLCIIALLLAAHLFARFFPTGIQIMNADHTTQNTNHQSEQTDQDELDALDHLAEHYDTSFWNAI